MTPAKFIEVFDTIAEAPGGIERLRELVLQLAVRGKLVPQDKGDEPPISILERNAKKKKCLADQRKISKPKSLPRLSLDEVPFNVPETWQWIRLGDVALVVMGNSPPGSSYNEQGLGVPLINGPVEFSAGAFGLSICRKYTTKPNQMCTTGDMLICVRGATTGRTNIAAFDACIGRGVALVRAWDAQRYVNLYLWYVGKELLAAGKGTTFPSISYADLAGKLLPLPPLAEQHRIVAKVDELTVLIDRLAAVRRSREDCRTAARDSALAALRIATNSEGVETAWTCIAERMDDLITAPADLAALRETVLQLAVRGRLVPQDTDDEPAEVLMERIWEERAQLIRAKQIRPQKQREPITCSQLKIPQGWKHLYLGDVIDMEYGKSLPLTERKALGDIPVYGSNGIVGQHDVALVNGPCIVVGRKGSAGAVNIARTSCWPIDTTYFVRTLRSMSLKYTSLMLLAARLEELDRSTAIPGLNREEAYLRDAFLPPLAEQHRIVAKVDELMELINRLEQHLVVKEENHEALAAAVHHL